MVGRVSLPGSLTPIHLDDGVSQVIGVQSSLASQRNFSHILELLIYERAHPLYGRESVRIFPSKISERLLFVSKRFLQYRVLSVWLVNKAKDKKRSKIK